ncbi:universal stress protein [Piscirickettsia litoralis]|uniref:Universal stress protein n=1 Tax=Piscirickettsia litoralis TaxID=1891921 RepID=A0ABX3A4H9_9GAMM|nr:universal stress protein [Piscirickettsia litoralis]ODN43425.1 universal stress family protein [Piscirickettsia litoralis]
MTKRYQHVLYATDLNDKSNSAAEEAQSLAELFNAKFSLLHVVRPIATTYGYIGDYELERQLMKEAKTQMVKLGDQLGVGEENLHLVEGYPKEDIIEFSDEIGADLIVLNGHRHHFLGTLGSVANAVANKSNCDVLVLASEKN